MRPSGSPGRAWGRACFPIAIILSLSALAGLALVFSTWHEARSEKPELLRKELAIPDALVATDELGESVTTLDLEISSAILKIAPVGADEPLQIDADFDPRYYELEHEIAGGPDSHAVHRIRFLPKSAARALIKMKIGHEPPRIQISLPIGRHFDLEGNLGTAFAALELGGLTIGDLDLSVDGGAVNVSLLKPLSAPMESLSIVGDKGSIEVTGLGHASPRDVRLHQRLGELDLDLRGPWSRDATLDLKVFMAGGSLWLPSNVLIDGLDSSQSLTIDDRNEELGKPRLRINLSRSGGELVMIE